MPTPRLVQAPADGVMRKRSVALDPREPLLLRRADDLAVFQQRRGRIVIEGRNAEDSHHHRLLPCGGRHERQLQLVDRTGDIRTAKRIGRHRPSGQSAGRRNDNSPPLTCGQLPPLAFVVLLGRMQRRDPHSSAAQTGPGQLDFRQRQRIAQSHQRRRLVQRQRRHELRRRRDSRAETLPPPCGRTFKSNGSQSLIANSCGRAASFAPKQLGPVLLQVIRRHHRVKMRRPRPRMAVRRIDAPAQSPPARAAARCHTGGRTRSSVFADRDAGLRPQRQHRLVPRLDNTRGWASCGSVSRRPGVCSTLRSNLPHGCDRLAIALQNSRPPAASAPSRDT